MVAGRRLSLSFCSLPYRISISILCVLASRCNHRLALFVSHPIYNARLPFHPLLERHVSV